MNQHDKKEIEKLLKIKKGYLAWRKMSREEQEALFMKLFLEGKVKLEEEDIRFFLKYSL